MQYVTQPKKLTVIELHNEWNGHLKGTRIIQEENGHVFTATPAEWEALRAVPATGETTNTRTNVRAKETLTAPRPFPMKGTSEKIAHVLTEAPMSTADIAKAAGVSRSQVSNGIKPLVEAHIAERHERGLYSLGRKAVR